MTEVVGPVSVEIDIPVTRRTKIHAVVDGNGDQVFHSRHIMEILGFLRSAGVSSFTALDDNDEFMLILQPPLAPPPRKKG